MSLYSAKTGISSILKSITADEREKALKKVRFSLPKDRGLLGVIDDVIKFQNYRNHDEFISFLHQCDISDTDLIQIISEARKSLHILNPRDFAVLVESILSINWIARNSEIIKEYSEFIVELLVAHNKYSNFVIHKLIVLWIPEDSKECNWLNGNPNDEVKKYLKTVHMVLGKILNVIPMTFGIVTDKLDELFPYFKKPSHVISGFIYNILLLLENNPKFIEFVMEILFKRLLILDVNAPRNEIEDSEMHEDIEDDIADEACLEKKSTNFPLDIEAKMKHPIAETLDICMKKLFEFSIKFNSSDCIHSMVPESDNSNLIDKRNHKKTTSKKYIYLMNYFKVLLNVFGNFVLPSHNTHHVQFIVFHYCSFKPFLVENFLTFLWSKMIDPNVSALIRQASVGYIASFLARARFVSLNTIKHYLNEMCSWAHTYINRSDSVRSNFSLRANGVFFSICQAVFYVIAFRSRDLTGDKKGLLFLQSLQLSSLVTCNFNPLRVCLPAVATTFAGVTRAHQLAYCHTILERNARRKLATIYGNDEVSPLECLETFFPFDPYLLIKSGKTINSLYLQYQASEAEEESVPVESYSRSRRKRGDSEMIGDELDDFINDKKIKYSELIKSQFN